MVPYMSRKQSDHTDHCDIEFQIELLHFFTRTHFPKLSIYDLSNYYCCCPYDIQSRFAKYLVRYSLLELIDIIYIKHSNLYKNTFPINVEPLETIFQVKKHHDITIQSYILIDTFDELMKRVLYSGLLIDYDVYFDFDDISKSLSDYSLIDLNLYPAKFIDIVIDIIDETINEYYNEYLSFLSTCSISFDMTHIYTFIDSFKNVSSSSFHNLNMFNLSIQPMFGDNTIDIHLLESFPSFSFYLHKPITSIIMCKDICCFGNSIQSYENYIYFQLNSKYSKNIQYLEISSFDFNEEVTLLQSYNDTHLFYCEIIQCRLQDDEN
ncbi:hypothetical protein WA158_005904 [Blastocystis sp. Blastoise]